MGQAGGLVRKDKFHTRDQNCLWKRVTLVAVGTGEFASFRKAVSPPTQMALCWMSSSFLHSSLLGAEWMRGPRKRGGFQINKRRPSHLRGALPSEPPSLAPFPTMEVRSIPKQTHYYNIWKLRFGRPFWPQKNNKSDIVHFNVLHICVDPSSVVNRWIQQQNLEVEGSSIAPTLPSCAVWFGFDTSMVLRVQHTWRISC